MPASDAQVREPTAARRAEGPCPRRAACGGTLGECEERFRAVAEVSSAWESWFSPSGAVCWVNAAIERFAGFTAEECLGWSDYPLRLVHQDDRERVRALLAGAARGTAGQGAEFRIVRSDGTAAWMEMSWQPAFGETGRHLGFRTSIRKVQALKRAEHELRDLGGRAEEAVRASQQRLSLLVEQSPLGVIDWNRWGEVVGWNPAVARILEYTKEEVLGCHLSLFVPAEARTEVGSLWRRVLRGELPHTHWDCVARSGRTVSCEWYNQPLVDAGGAIVGVASLVVDVTDSKRVERERRRLWEAVEQSPSTVVITDTTGAIEYVNPMFERTTGWRASEAIGKKTSLLKSGVHDSSFYGELWATIVRGEAWHGEMCNKRRSGELYWERVSISPARDEAGVITHYIAIKEEITARRKAAVELERARDAAEAANRAKSAFLASMSHEIRTPLHAILGYAQVTARDASLGAQARRNLEVIHRSGEHLLALVDDVLEMSKIEAGRATLDLAGFDLRALVADLEAMFRLRAEEKALRFEVAVAEDVPRSVVGDEGKLRQILTNLLGNAIKFTERGRVTLSLRATRGRGGGVVLHAAVTDTGVGIRSDEIASLFQEFEQTESGRRLQSGTGLGLALSRSYARLMGGDVGVRSEPGRGSAFQLEVPLQEVAPPAAPPQRGPRRRVVSARKPGGAQVRALVADEGATNRGWLRQSLEGVGFAVDEARDARETFELFRERRHDVVLLGRRTPLDGEAAARAIRGAPGGDRAAIVVLSADSREQDRDAMLACGADAVLGDPVREAELFEALRHRLGLELVHEADADAPRESAVPPTAADVAALPPDLLEAMRSAVRRGDVDRLHALLDAAGETAPGVRQLRSLARRFDLGTLQDVLSADGRNAGRGGGEAVAAAARELDRERHGDERHEDAT